MFEVSLRPSLRLLGAEKNHSEVLRTASSYYLPEGRFFASPVILKKKNRNYHILSAFLGLGVSLVSVSSIGRFNEENLVAKTTTILNRTAVNAQEDGGIVIDPVTTASIKMPEQYRALPLTAENEGGKLGISDPDPDENRINRAEKTAGLNDRQSNALPVLNKPALDRVSIHKNTIAADLKHMQTLVVPSSTSKPEKMATLIKPVIKKERPNLPVPKILASLVNNNTPDILALGYASTGAKANSSAFDGVLNERASRSDGRFIPPIGSKDHTWAATPLPASAFSVKEQKCLSEAVYYEARGESVKGQVAVAQVVLNRVRNPAYPNSICGVVYQNINLHNRCQFSFACDGKKHHVTEIPEWNVAQQVAKAVSAGQIWLAEVGSATHYHAIYVRPNWASTMTKVDKIGYHIFYRTRYGGWS